MEYTKTVSVAFVVRLTAASCTVRSYLEELIAAQLVRKFPAFMKPSGSWPNTTLSIIILVGLFAPRHCDLDFISISQFRATSLAHRTQFDIIAVAVIVLGKVWPANNILTPYAVMFIFSSLSLLGPYIPPQYPVFNHHQSSLSP
jgi:hypothetical protein